MTRILTILLIVSVAANLYLGFLLLDAGIVLDNARSVADQLWDRREVALHIMRRDWIGRSADEVDDLAQELKREGVIVGVEGNVREIGEFLFYIDDGVVVDVQDFESGVQLER